MDDSSSDEMFENFGQLSQKLRDTPLIVENFDTSNQLSQKLLQAPLVVENFNAKYQLSHNLHDAPLIVENMESKCHIEDFNSFNITVMKTEIENTACYFSELSFSPWFRSEIMDFSKLFAVLIIIILLYIIIRCIVICRRVKRTPKFIEELDEKLKKMEQVMRNLTRFLLCTEHELPSAWQIPQNNMLHQINIKKIELKRCVNEVSSIITDCIDIREKFIIYMKYDIIQNIFTAYDEVNERIQNIENKLCDKNYVIANKCYENLNLSVKLRQVFNRIYRFQNDYNI